MLVFLVGGIGITAYVVNKKQKQSSVKREKPSSEKRDIKIIRGKRITLEVKNNEYNKNNK